MPAYPTLVWAGDAPAAGGAVVLRIHGIGPVAVVRLDHGKVNALDLELCGRITEAFRQLDQDGDVGAVVLTGTGTSFSAGVDLRRIAADGPAYARRFLPVLDDAFLAIFGLDKPVVAALNGHALAGGYVVASACDVRLLADGAAQVGVPELLAGVPFPSTALEILRHAVGPRANSLVLTGARHAGRRAVELGLVDDVVGSDDLEARAVELATELAGRIPAAAYALSKQQLRFQALERVAAGRRQFEDRVAEQWARDDAGAWIDEYLARLARR